MAVLVDPVRDYPDARLPVTRWCHMVTDGSFEELHAFAERLGIARRRFQGDHYDLHPALRARAVLLGAHEVTIHDLTLRMAGPRGDRNRARRAAREGAARP